MKYLDTVSILKYLNNYSLKSVQYFANIMLSHVELVMLSHDDVMFLSHHTTSYLFMSYEFKSEKQESVASNRVFPCLAMLCLRLGS